MDRTMQILELQQRNHKFEMEQMRKEWQHKERQRKIEQAIFMVGISHAIALQSLLSPLNFKEK